MLLKQARTVCCKKWAAKHDCEELKGGAWLEPIQAVLRRDREMEGGQTSGGWVQKRLYDIC